MKRALLAAVVVLLAVVSLGAKPRRTYLNVLHEHTRHQVVYFGFQTALNVRATLLTAPMREALASERRRLMAPSIANHEEFSRRMIEDEASFYEVVFSADSAVEGAQKFGEGDGTWNLRMVADGAEQPLVSVEWIRRPSPVHRGLYPHLNIWSELWIARFERTIAEPERISMTVGSGYGNTTLIWEPGADR